MTDALLAGGLLAEGIVLVAGWCVVTNGLRRRAETGRKAASALFAEGDGAVVTPPQRRDPGGGRVAPDPSRL